MGTRTVRIIGKAYAESGTVTVVASMNGNEIFNGPVPTVVGDAYSDNTELKNGVDSAFDVLFSFEVDDTLSGVAIPSVIQVAGGVLRLVTYSANKMNYDNLDQFVTNWNVDVKTDIIIDGTPLEKNEDDNTGTWHVFIEDGSVASMIWNLRPVPAGLPGNPREPGSPHGPEYGPPY